MIEIYKPGKKMDLTFEGYYTVKQIGEFFGVKKPCLYRWVKMQRFPAPIWKCGRYVWSIADIDALRAKNAKPE